MWLQCYVCGDGWTGWTSLGGTFASGPSATARGAEVLVMAKRPAGRLAWTVRPTPASAWRSWVGVDPLQPFRRLSTWVDVFDYAALDPQTAVADMADRGVRTLFLSTARFTSADDFHNAAEAGAWLDAAHAAGIKVVGGTCRPRRHGA